MPIDFSQSWKAPVSPRAIVAIGTGGIMRDAHLPAYKKAGFKIAGAVDKDVGRVSSIAAEWNIPEVFVSVEAAAAAFGAGCVYDIAVPPHVITEILPSLPDEATVLIQKPMGADLKQAKAIRQICRKKRLKAAINFQLRFSPMMLAVKDAVLRGLLGELLEIEIHLNVFTPWDLFPFLIPMKRVEIMVHSIHYLDLIRAMAGNPEGVFARSIGDPRAEKFAQTRTTAILDYESALRCTMSINHNHRCGRKFQSAWFRFEGTEGCMMVKLGVIYDYPKGEPDELWYCGNGREWEQVKLEGRWFIDAFMGPMRNLQRFADGEDSELYSGIEDAYQTMALVEACYRAMDRPAEPVNLD